jgi:cytochrome c-type biogenesis protein CcmH
LAVLAVALAAQTVSTGDPTHARLREIGEKLKCQCTQGGCAYTVGSCNMLHCHFREEVHDQMRADIAAGASDDTIIGKLKEKYGTLILAAPPAQGFNLMGWVMPFAALLLGLVVLRAVILRWRRPALAGGGMAGATSAAVVSPSPLLDKYRDQIEKELEDSQ